MAIDKLSFLAARLCESATRLSITGLTHDFHDAHHGLSAMDDGAQTVLDPAYTHKPSGGPKP